MALLDQQERDLDCRLGAYLLSGKRLNCRSQTFYLFGLCEGFAAFCCRQGQPGEMPSDVQSNGTDGVNVNGPMVGRWGHFGLPL